MIVVLKVKENQILRWIRFGYGFFFKKKYMLYHFIIFILECHQTRKMVSGQKNIIKIVILPPPTIGKR